MAVNYAQEMAVLAKSLVGIGEPDGDDQFITYYNSITGATFSVDTTPWCAIFVTYVARKCGVPTSVIPNFASCTTSRDSFWIPRNRWYKRSGYNPKIGDLIYFDYDGSGNCDHVGIVIDNDGTYVYVVEGNAKGGTNVYGVRSNKYRLSYSAITGYASPDYDGEGSTTTDSSSTAAESEYTTGIKQFQSWLNWYIDAGLIIDGSCGSLTKAAAVRALQNCLNTNYGMSLDVDGSYGPLTKAAVKTIEYCSVGTLSYIVQGLLFGHKFDTDTFDGIYAKATEDAVKQFQKWAGITVDGCCGPDTWYNLNKKW